MHLRACTNKFPYLFNITLRVRNVMFTYLFITYVFAYMFVCDLRRLVCTNSHEHVIHTLSIIVRNSVYELNYGVFSSMS